MKKNIITGHNFCQYRRKYGKKFDKGKLEYFTLEDKNKLNSKKKYWEIRDGKKPGYFQIPKKKGLIIFFWLLGAAALATAVTVPAVLLTRNKGQETETEHNAKVEIEGEGCSYEIEGGESLEGHQAGDVIVIDFTIEWGNDFTVEVTGAESYTYDETTGQLTIVFGDKDVSIVAQATRVETVTDQDTDDVIEVTYADSTVDTMSINQFRNDIIAKVDADGNSYVGCTAKLLKNVELDNDDKFQPLANENESVWYAGNFKGNNKVMKITQSSVGLTGYDAGLFADVYGDIDDPILFSNLKLDLDIKSGSNGQFVGGLIGYAIGSMDIYNIEIDGTIKGSRVVGGIVGTAERNSDSEDNPLPDVMHVNNCVINADVQGYARRTSDNWAKVGGLFGQVQLGDIGGEHEAIAGLEINDCSFNGNLSDDFTACTSTHYSLMGYITSSSGSEGTNEKTVINNFTVSPESTISSDSTTSGPSYYPYPFEGLNVATGEPSYEGTPNYYKELVGGYFNTVIVDGEVNPTKQGVCFPHGGTY